MTILLGGILGYIWMIPMTVKQIPELLLQDFISKDTTDNFDSLKYFKVERI